MQTYESLLKVTQYDLDELNHVNNVRYVQWVQEIAKNHWTAATTHKIRETYFWIMLSHLIEYKHPALLNDVIKLKTYVTKAEGVTSVRVVEITNNNTNKLLAKSETTWCFMNSNTMKPNRIPEGISKIFQ